MQQEQVRQAEVQTLRAEAQASQAEAQTQRAEAQASQAEVQTLRAEAQTSQAEAQTLRAEAQASQAEAQTLRAEAQASQAEIQTMRTEVQTLRADLAREQARAKKGPAPATEALVEALAAYIDSGQDLQENMHPATLAQATAKYAKKINLPSAHLLKPKGGTAHTLMNAALRGLRHSREYDRKKAKINQR
jgi:hypothetical protein